jgi:hypothetical protein
VWPHSARAQQTDRVRVIGATTSLSNDPEDKLPGGWASQIQTDLMVSSPCSNVGDTNQCVLHREPRLAWCNGRRTGFYLRGVYKYGRG